jgi:hypothetical protein
MNEIKGARRYCVKRVCRLGQGSRVQVGRLPLVFGWAFIHFGEPFFSNSKTIDYDKVEPWGETQCNGSRLGRHWYLISQVQRVHQVSLSSTEFVGPATMALTFRSAFMSNQLGPAAAAVCRLHAPLGVACSLIFWWCFGPLVFSAPVNLRVSPLTIFKIGHWRGVVFVDSDGSDDRAAGRNPLH